jgi:hypothetical protein
LRGGTIRRRTEAPKRTVVFTVYSAGHDCWIGGQLRVGLGLTTMRAMSDVTQILYRIDSGDPQAAEQLLPLVYDELRKLAAAKLAHEKPGQTLQATALVHEAYLRLIGCGARDSGLGAEGEVCDLLPPAPNPEPRAPAFESRGH